MSRLAGADILERAWVMKMTFPMLNSMMSGKNLIEMFLRFLTVVSFILMYKSC